MKKVLVGGCFDLIHYGHIVFLKKAKSLGNHLVVALESDENVRRAKGNNRPIHTQQMRYEMLSSLSMVDEVLKLKEMKTDKDYFQLVENVKPSFIAVTKGDPQIKNKKKQAKAVGARIVVVTKRILPYSSTHLIEKLGL